MEYKKGLNRRLDQYIVHDSGVRVNVSYVESNIEHVEVHSWNPSDYSDEQIIDLRANLEWHELSVLMDVITGLVNVNERE